MHGNEQIKGNTELSMDILMLTIRLLYCAKHEPHPFMQQHKSMPSWLFYKRNKEQ